MSTTPALASEWPMSTTSAVASVSEPNRKKMHNPKTRPSIELADYVGEILVYRTG